MKTRMDLIKWQQNTSNSASDSDEEEGSDTCQTLAASSSSQANPGRKRRRGIIEKRRRDRINLTLSELKRLVPAALEKSNSAKLEKAEILQMTVEHLKLIQDNRTGSNGYVDAYTTQQDAHRIAFEYHAIGFRECAAEVARYLGGVEGMEVPEATRVRLLTHLQMFASQKPAAYAHTTASAYGQMPVAAAATAQAWTGYGNPTTYTPPTPYNYCDTNAKGLDTRNETTVLPPADPLRYFSSQTSSSTTAANSRPTTSNTTTSTSAGTTGSAYNAQYGCYGGTAQTYFSAFGAPASATAAAVAATQLQAATSQHHQQIHNQLHHNESSVTSSTSPPASTTSPINGMEEPINGHHTALLPNNYVSHNKPYRPWGAEMASC